MTNFPAPLRSTGLQSIGAPPLSSPQSIYAFPSSALLAHAILQSNKLQRVTTLNGSKPLFKLFIASGSKGTATLCCILNTYVQVYGQFRLILHLRCLVYTQLCLIIIHINARMYICIYACIRMHIKQYKICTQTRALEVKLSKTITQTYITSNALTHTHTYTHEKTHTHTHTRTHAHA